MTAMQQTVPENGAEKKGEVRPFGPDSLMWQDFGSQLFQLILPQAFILQSAHPVIDAAVGKEKKYKHDPWGRARNSIAMLWPIVYARPETAIAMGKQLRELHRAIKGVDKNGKKYHALDPDAYSWVHITGFDATLRMHALFGTPLTAEQRAQVFEEWKQMGALLGIADKYIPQTEDEYWRHFNSTIEERLIWGEVVEDLMDRWHYARWPKPPQSSMPNFVWKMLITPLSPLLQKIIVATLPDNFRKRFNVRYSALDRLFFRGFAWLVKTLYPRLPESQRYIPLARRAIEDARRHPEAYRYEPEAAANI